MATVAQQAQLTPQGRARLALAMACLQSGTWGTVAGPDQLQASASGLGLGDAAFIPFWPERLSGDNGPFDPFTDASRPGA